MITRALIDEVLEELATDPEGILKYTGTTGARYASGACPVAKYLSDTFPDEYINICTSVVLVKDLVVRLPDNLKEFVRQFDNGHYPELDSERGVK